MSMVNIIKQTLHLILTELENAQVNSLGVHAEQLLHYIIRTSRQFLPMPVAVCQLSLHQRLDLDYCRAARKETTK